MAEVAGTIEVRYAPAFINLAGWWIRPEEVKWFYLANTLSGEWTTIHMSDGYQRDVRLKPAEVAEAINVGQ